MSKVVISTAIFQMKHVPLTRLMSSRIYRLIMKSTSSQEPETLLTNKGMSFTF